MKKFFKYVMPCVFVCLVVANILCVCRVGDNVVFVQKPGKIQPVSVSVGVGVGNSNFFDGSVYICNVVPKSANACQNGVLGADNKNLVATMCSDFVVNDEPQVFEVTFFNNTSGEVVLGGVRSDKVTSTVSNVGSAILPQQTLCCNVVVSSGATNATLSFDFVRQV
ncbi:MAG: hypothetical protein IJV77_04145 [Clostridia bacterium]|nr:hypothetical protein [Clostridia bacterium]